MDRFRIGQYVTVQTPHSAILWDAKIIGGPNRLEYSSWQTQISSIAHPAQNLWTIRIDADDTTRVVLESNIVLLDGRKIINLPEPKYAECPECGEVEFFLEDDYVCGWCRTIMLDTLT